MHYCPSHVLLLQQKEYIYSRAFVHLSAILDMVCASQRSCVLGVEAVLIEF